MSFGSVELFRNVNLRIDPGEKILLDGDVGSGKTVFMRLLSGMVIPSQGVVSYKGKPFYYTMSNAFFAQRAEISYLLEGLQPQDNLSVFENLALPYRVRGQYDESLIQSLVMDKLKKVALDKKAEQRPERLSMEEKNILVILMALKENTRFFVVDEAFPQLNDNMKGAIRDIFAERYDERRSGIIMSRDDYRDWNLAYDRVFYLRNNQVFVESA